MNAFRKSFEGHGRRRLNMFNTSFENSKRALFREQKEDKHPTILHFYKIRSASQRSAVTKYFQPAIGPKSIDSNSRSLSLADRQPLRTQTQPASQTSQPSRPSQSRQAASLDIFYLY